MRKMIALFVAALAGVVPTAEAAAPGPTGWLVGRTQISFGCPGPAAEGSATCNPWRTFPNARLTVARGDSAAGPTAVRRLVVSGADGRFRLRLPAGDYVLTPLAQPHTRGGAVLHVRVRVGKVTRAMVRFQGFPQMV